MLQGVADDPTQHEQQGREPSGSEHRPESPPEQRPSDVHLSEGKSMTVLPTNASVLLTVSGMPSAPVAVSQVVVIQAAESTPTAASAAHAASEAALAAAAVAAEAAAAVQSASEPD
jgi:hypothetical protein